MSLFHLLLVAIIQGITEFLPVSSSGHLILLPGLTGMDDQGLMIDVAVHVGTLGAVVLYFRSDVARAVAGLGDLIRGDRTSADARLALNLIIATVPVVIAGFLLHLSGQTDALRNIAVIGWTMLLFGILLYWADQRSETTLTAADWTWRHALSMGLWQALALIPGTSRSGITITGARLLGYAREDAARLAMLMSIPTILASGTLLGLDVLQQGDVGAARDGALAALFAFLAAYLSIAVMMRLLKRLSYTPYVIYRVILGIVLLTIAYR